jgi:hypothetical protein
MMMTGESSSGKSQIYNNVVKPLAALFTASGKNTTANAISRLIGKDARGVAIEEFEAKSENEKYFRNEMLGMARNSTSDDTPNSYKCGRNNTVESFRKQAMFLFVAIHAAIDNDADENRTFFINFDKAGDAKENKWKVLEKQVHALFNEKNCRGVRALTWQNLPFIIDLADEVRYKIKTITGYDSRMSYADAILFSAWYYIFHEGTILEQALAEYYCDFENDRIKESVSDDFFDMLMNTSIPCAETQYKKVPIREMLYAVRTGESMH